MILVKKDVDLIKFIKYIYQFQLLNLIFNIIL